MKALTKEQAVALAASGWWKDLEPSRIVGFQLFEPLLCMPFGEFHAAVEAALGRSVWTHEFGLNMDGIKKEFLGEKEAPTFAEILELIPEEKRIVVAVSS